MYDFATQLKMGKDGEAVVLFHIQKRSNVISVKDLSEDKAWQSLWIDAMCIYEGESWLYYATFFDVKTDFKWAETGNIFLEVSSSKDVPGCLLTTKAETFIYYCPKYGRIAEVPVFQLREWYNRVGISKVHHTVDNGTRQSEGVTISEEELLRIAPWLVIESNVAKLYL